MVIVLEETNTNGNKIVFGSTWIVFGSDVQDKTIVYCLFMVNKT